MQESTIEKDIRSLLSELDDPTPQVTSLGALLDEVDEGSDEWIVDAFLPASGTSLVAGMPKAGKTTLLCNLAFAVARGEDFLGRETLQGPVVYIALEGKRSEFGRLFAAMGADGSEPIGVHVGAIKDEDPYQYVENEIRATGAALCIIDPLGRFLQARSLNSYGQVNREMEKVGRIAETTGCHIMLVHHATKGKRGKGAAQVIEKSLGSTALPGAVDTIVGLDKGEEDEVTITSVQRYGDDLPESRLVMDPSTRLVTLAGRVERATEDRLVEAILEMLHARPGLTEPEIRADIGGNQRLTAAALRRLLSIGHIARTGDGKRGDPFRYTALAVPPSLRPDDD